MLWRVKQRVVRMLSIHIIYVVSLVVVLEMMECFGKKNRLVVLWRTFNFK
jgi:hypothetical protein